MNIFAQDLVSAAAQLESVADQLKDQTVFMTGGTGYVGTWLLFSFLELLETYKINSRMLILSRDPAAFYLRFPQLKNLNTLNLIKGDVRNFVYPTQQVDLVIHAATDVVRPHQNNHVVIETNYVGTNHVLDFCRAQSVRKYLYISSGAVYGKTPDDLALIPETYVGAPDTSLAKSAYGEGKRLAEWLSFDAARTSSLEVKVARLFALVGPHLPLDAHFAIGNFISDILSGNPIKISGDGSPVRSYLYGSDMAVWLWKILLEGKNGQSYNVGSDHGITIAGLASKVAQIAEGTVTHRAPRSNLAGPQYVPEISKASTLGLKVNVNLDQAIRRMLLFHGFTLKAELTT